MDSKDKRKGYIQIIIAMVIWVGICIYCSVNLYWYNSKFENYQI